MIVGDYFRMVSRLRGNDSRGNAKLLYFKVLQGGLYHADVKLLGVAEISRMDSREKHAGMTERKLRTRVH